MTQNIPITLLSAMIFTILGQLQAKESKATETESALKAKTINSQQETEIESASSKVQKRPTKKKDEFQIGKNPDYKGQQTMTEHKRSEGTSGHDQSRSGYGETRREAVGNLSSRERAAEGLRQLNGDGVIVYDPKNNRHQNSSNGLAVPYRRGNLLHRGEQLLNRIPPYRGGTPPAGHAGRGRGRSGVGAPVGRGTQRPGRDYYPSLSLPIGLPSIDIVHVPGATWTSNAKVEYRTIGAPAPHLGPGNLVHTGNRRRTNP